MTPQQNQLHEAINVLRQDLATSVPRAGSELLDNLERWRVVLDAAASTLPKEPVKRPEPIDHVVLCCCPNGAVVVSMGVQGDHTRGRRTKSEAEECARTWSAGFKSMRYVAVKVPS